MDWEQEKKLILLLLSGIVLVVVLIGVLYPAEKHEEIPPQDSEEGDVAIVENENSTPEEYVNPLYCNENVECAAGRTVTNDLLINNLVTDCVNTYHAQDGASRTGCECIEELSMCAAVPTSYMNLTGLKNSTDSVNVIVSIPRPDPVFESFYGALDLIEIYGLGENNSWGLIASYENAMCSRLKSPAVEKLVVAMNSTKTHFVAGTTYKTTFTYFTDPECKIKRTSEREFTIPD